MKSQKRLYIIVAVLIAAQLITIICSFQFRKEGTHIDELWSYGYANSFFTREIFMDDNREPINLDRWISGKHLWDYLVVNEGEQFRFDSVYYNKQNDISPFLHSMILHAVCSFFPETFSLWYSFAINIVAFIVCMIFLFKIARMLMDDRFAIFCCILYGFSLAARDTFIYLRMYAMSTALIMAYLYFTIKYVRRAQEDKKQCFSLLPVLMVLAWISFITNFYDISFVGIVTFLICVYLLSHRKVKQMFAYGFSMLASLGAAVVLMPNLFSKTASYGSDVAGAMGYFTFSMKLKLFLNFVLKKFFYITISIYPSPAIPILAGVMVYILILLIPVMILVRKEPFAQRAIARMKYIVSHKGESIRKFVQWVNWMYVILFVTVITQIIVTCNTSDVEVMGVYADRYIFFLYPLIALLLFACIYKMVQKLFKKGNVRQFVLALLTVILLCVNTYGRSVFSLYLFPKDTDKEIEGEPIEKAVEGKDCIFLSADVSRVITLSNRLMYANSYFQTSPKTYQDFEQEFMDKLSEGGQVMLVVSEADFMTAGQKLNELMMEGIDMDMQDMENMEMDTDNPYQEMLDYFDALVPESKMQQVASEFAFTKEISVFVLNP